MKEKLLILLLFCSVLNAQSYQQTSNYKVTALDVITEPASIAMGESFVANPFGKLSFFENPATLSKEHPTSIFYFSRSHDWIDLAKGFRYASMGVTSSSPLGHVGFVYSQFSTGRVGLPDGQELYSEEMNKLYLLSLSRSFFNHLTVGVSVKVFNHSRKSNFISNYELTSNNPFIFDFGIHYSFNPVNINERTKFSSFLGASIQNFGQDYKETDHLKTDREVIVQLPRYFRAGFTGNIVSANKDGEPDLVGTISAEYKRLLNPMSKDNDEINYLGAGGELIIKEYFSARLGIFKTPEKTLLYDQNKIYYRFGIGLNLPLEKIGVNIPAILSLDYTFIPINKFEGGTDGAASNKSTKLLQAVGISLYYRNLLF